MKVKSTILILLVACSGMLFSCGSSKKLSEANTKILNLEAENGQLSSKVNSLQKQVSDLGSQNQTLASQNKTLNDQFTTYKKDCDNCQQQLKEVSEAMDQMDENVQQLHEKIKAAEAEFADKGLDVYSKDGVVYVDMKDNLLYKSGSAALSKDGKKALGNLATVLNDYPNLKVIVVGNTDTMHVKGIADNWSLSTERANGVVRTLVKDYKMEPGRLTAAGKGKFNPIADNSTNEGRAKNRRTEIVLNPNWEKLWESVKKE